MDLISVIVPIYNVEQYLEKCLNSICKQTYENLQIILVNDGSPDCCPQICDEYAKKDKRITVIHKQNGGLSDARNVALDIAVGKYVSFVDSDDYIEHDMIEQLYHACIVNEVKIAICGRYNVCDNEIVPSFTLDSAIKMTAKECVERLLMWNGLDSAAWDKLYDISLFEGIRYPKGKLHEDIPVTYKLFIKAGEIVHVGVPLYYYLKRTGSITSNKFSQKRFDLFEHAMLAKTDIDSKYSDLERSTNFFISKITLYLIRCISKDVKLNEFKKEYMMLKKVLIRSLMHGISKTKDVKEKDILKVIIMPRWCFRCKKRIKDIIAKWIIEDEVSSSN